MKLTEPLARELTLAVKFAAVCMIGFVVDAGGTKAGVMLGLSAPLSRFVALLAALQVTFVLSRWLVFHNAGQGSLAGQWWRYMIANGFGGFCNFGIFVALIALRWPFLSNLWVALVVSASTAYFINYAGTRLYVYGRDMAAPLTKAHEEVASRPVVSPEP